MTKKDLTRVVQISRELAPVISTFQDIMNRKAQQEYYDSAVSALNQAKQAQQELAYNKLPLNVVSALIMQQQRNQLQPNTFSQIPSVGNQTNSAFPKTGRTINTKNQVLEAANLSDRNQGENNNFNSSNVKVQNSTGDIQIPQDAISHLKSHPELKVYFDKKYGQGTSDQYLTR